MRRYFALLTIALFLAACSTQQQKSAVTAATSPLTDLNLVQSKIPEALRSAHVAPYAIPADNNCEQLTTEILSLDDALGPDLDAPATATDPGLIERAGDLVSDQAVSAIRHTAEGVVPFRSWVRKLSGAERHSRQVDAAIAAGIVRRAFLKGLRTNKACETGVASTSTYRSNSFKTSPQIP